MILEFGAFLNAAIWAILGVVIFAGSFYILDKMTPGDLWRQIVEEKNIALAILVGAMSLGLGIIIAAAVH